MKSDVASSGEYGVIIIRGRNTVIFANICIKVNIYQVSGVFTLNVIMFLVSETGAAHLTPHTLILTSPALQDQCVT